MPTLPGSTARTHAFSRSSAGVPSAITCPQWITEMRSASANRKRMSCSMMTIVSVRFSSAISSASRAVPDEPSPAVGSSRNSRRGCAASATPISSARRSPYDRLFAAHVLLAGEARREPAPRPPRRARRRRGRGRATSRTPRARTAGSAMQHVVERRVVVEQVHHLERARQPLARDAPRRQPGDVLAGEAHAAAVGTVAAGEHVEAGGLAGAVRDP